MGKKFSVAIIGNGRMAQAARLFLLKSPRIKNAEFITEDKELKKRDIFVGALAGGIARRCLDLALLYKKPLFDISDVDLVDYLPREKEILKRGITVIPGCGFCPGVVNLIIGRELNLNSLISSIEMKAGSLSPRKFYYPFLWCFEDIVLEHRLDSWQLISGKRKKFPAFDGYQKEKYFGVPAESYLSASGFEHMLGGTKIKNFTTRVVRPLGFREFFRNLENYQFLSEENLPRTKLICESRKEDNISFAEINFKSPQEEINWSLKSNSSKTEALNSMQKITACVSAVMVELFLSGEIQKSGIVPLEELAKDERVFNQILEGVRKRGVVVARRRNFGVYHLDGKLTKNLKVKT